MKLIAAIYNQEIDSFTAFSPARVDFVGGIAMTSWLTALAITATSGHAFCRGGSHIFSVAFHDGGMRAGRGLLIARSD